MKKLSFVLLIISSFAVTGCSWFDPFDSIVYKADRQQGNILEQDDIDKIKPGMSKEQIEFILGKPVVADTFGGSTWYYLYSYTPGDGKVTKQRLILDFEDDKLVTISGNYKPDNTDELSASASQN